MRPKLFVPHHRFLGAVKTAALLPKFELPLKLVLLPRQLLGLKPDPDLPSDLPSEPRLELDLPPELLPGPILELKPPPTHWPKLKLQETPKLLLPPEPEPDTHPVQLTAPGPEHVCVKTA